jgi:SPP1 family predicted phage head-tail adaptor
MNAIQAGPMRQRLAFQAPLETSDGQGKTVTWPTTLATVWGSVEPIQGIERQMAARLVATSTHRWSIRYSSVMAVVTPKYRFTCKGRTFQILAVLNTEERNRELRGEAIEVTS